MRFVSEGIDIPAAQTQILAALSWGGILTEDQIRRATGVAARKVHRALAQLAARDLVFTGPKGGRWQITSKALQLLTVQSENEPSASSGRQRLNEHGHLVSVRRQR